MKRRLPFCVPFFCAILAGCGRVLAESDVPYAADILDNALEGIAQRDYGMFSRDFGAAMKDALKEDGFPAVTAALEEKLGEYGGKTFLSAGRTRSAVGDIVVVTYRARYSRDDDARIRIWISEKEGVRRIEGFFAGSSGDLK